MKEEWKKELLKDKEYTPVSTKGRPNARKKKIKWSDKLLLDKVITPLSKGVSLEEIARKLNITRNAVIQQLKKRYGVKNKTEAILEIMRRYQANESL